MKVDRYQFTWSESPRFPDMCGFCRREEPDDFVMLRFAYAKDFAEVGTEGLRLHSLWAPCCKRCRWMMWLRHELPKWFAVAFGGTFCAAGFAIGALVAGPRDSVGASIIVVCAGVGLALGLGMATLLATSFPPPLAIRGYRDRYEIEIAGTAYSAAFAEANGREKFNPVESR